MKILAFLQNPWFKPGTDERHVRMYAENDDFRRRVLAMSATGRALIRAFGEPLYSRIVWDNASPAHGERRDAQFPPDIVHMMTSIVRNQPDVLLLFGRQSQAGWAAIHKKFLDSRPGKRIVLEAAHPMARGSAIEHLRVIAEKVRRLCVSSR